MKRWSIALLIAVLLAGGVIASTPWSIRANEADARPEPQTNEGKKWRIGYTEGDPYFNYAGTFYYLVQGLETLGWVRGIEGLPYKAGQDDSREKWNWLATRDLGPYVEFVADAHYSLIDEQGLELKVQERLQRNDLDVMILMGTAAGRALANDRHSVPVMVFSSSNAVQSGIIASEHDSGLNHVWAHMDADRYKRQIQVFHDIFAFNKLGIVYENSALGRIYAAIDDVRAEGRERGFDVVEQFVDEPRDEPDKERYFNEVLAANRKLAGQVDAMYVTAGKWEVARFAELMQPFYEAGIPVFSQLGASEVQHGALLSLYRASYSGIGRFGAENIVRLFNGTPLRQLPQIYGDTPSIVLNLEVADKIGYRTPFDILLAADEIYTAITGQR